MYVVTKIIFWKKIRFVISEDVVTSHAYHRGDFTEKMNKQIPSVFSHADAIIAPAQHVVYDLVKRYHIPKHLIHVLPNWTMLHGAPKAKSQTVDCVYIGRLAKEKRLPLLLSLITRIRKQLPDISLLIMGQGEEQQMIRRIIKTTNLRNNVTIVKPNPNVTHTLARAKLAVFTSESEGSPHFLVEAMAMGLPVVALYFRGVEEIIANNKSGFICYNQAQFIRAVTTLLTNPRLRKSMGDYGKTIVDKRYAVSNINKYIDLLFPS
jgi:glycosyltransferase involved in cell wall biosynthesis